MDIDTTHVLRKIIGFIIADRKIVSSFYVSKQENGKKKRIFGVFA